MKGSNIIAYDKRQAAKSNLTWAKVRDRVRKADHELAKPRLGDFYPISGVYPMVFDVYPISGGKLGESKDSQFTSKLHDENTNPDSSELEIPENNSPSCRN